MHSCFSISDEDDDEDLDFDGELNAELSRQIKKRADRRARRKLKAKQKQLSMEEEVLNVRKKIARAKKKSGAELAGKVIGVFKTIFSLILVF